METTMLNDGKMKVRGIAIRAGVSRNGINYTKEELAKFAPTMQGVSILKDHCALVDNSIGVVEKGMSINDGNEVQYEGWIKDKAIEEKVKDGRVKFVSVGAIAGKLVKESEDSEFMTAKDMVCCELSTVVVPGVIGTSIKQSLNEINNATNIKDKLKVPAVYEDVSKFVSKEEFIKTKINVNEMMMEKETSPDEMDGHKHMAKCDDMTGMGKTDMNGNPEHEHEVKDFMVISFEKDGYKSVHSGSLKVEPEEKEKVDIETSKIDVEEKVKEENAKMDEAENKKLQESLEQKTKEIEAKEKLISEQEIVLNEFKAKEKVLEENKKKELVEQYNKLTEEKCVEKEDVSKLTIETLGLLIKQLTNMKTSTKGQVGEKKMEDINEELVYEKSEFGKGYSLFVETFDNKKFKRLSR